MNKLLFTVKLARTLVVLLGLNSVSCGYRPAYSGETPQRLSIGRVSSVVAEPEITQAVVAGARAELARADAGTGSGGYPMIVIEVLRVDDTPRAIAAVVGDTGLRPLARAMSVGVVGRAWVIEAPGGTPIRDTGDVRRVESYAVGTAGRADMTAYEAACQAAARELGAALVRRLLAEPTSTYEPM